MVKETILKHIKEATYEDPVTAQNLGVITNSDDNWDTSQPRIREMIRELITEGHPIGSKRTGYFYIKSEKHLNKYISSLQGRILGIEDRINKVKNAYNDNVKG